MTATAGPGPVRPVSAAGYWVGAAVLVLGIVAGIVVAAVGVVLVTAQPHETYRLPVPVQATVELEAGRWVVSRERPESETASYRPLPDITVIDPSGREVPLDPEGRHGFAFADQGWELDAMASFEVPRDGTYQVVVLGEPTGRQRVVLQSAFDGWPILAIVGGVGLGVVAVVVAGCFFLVTAVARSSARRPLAR